MMLKTKLFVYFSIVICSVVGCEQSSADCWPELLEGYASFLYEYEMGDGDASAAQASRAELREKLGFCTSDDELLSTPAESIVGNEGNISLFDIAILADDPNLTRLFEARFVTESIETKNDNDLLLGGKYLHIGAFFQSSKSIQVLLELGYDPNGTDEHRNTPLHVLRASDPVGLAIIRDLVAYGANIDSNNEDGVTPLMTARLKGDLAKAQCLVTLGAIIPPMSNFESWTIPQRDSEAVARIDSFLYAERGDVSELVLEICRLD